jgi:UDP-2,4-diacetamido-2,4,6-trideoxy-beta-L-altropyranose hydrolase
MTPAMNVVFRVDASARMGTGHLMRCLTLAESLRERGADARFICRPHVGHLIDLLRERAFEVSELPSVPDVAPLTDADYAAWLAVSQATDAAHTIEALGGRRPDWLIVDHYGVDADWEQALRPKIRRLMVIDDLASRRHVCDVLLDQNYWPEGLERYIPLVPHGCKLLVGPTYALLRPEYAESRKGIGPRLGDAGRVFVYFGGSDPADITRLALQALSVPELVRLSVDVVVGANYRYGAALQQLADARGGTTIHGPRLHLADLMAKADLAIGAGGATTWERLCLGLSSVVISTAANQEPGAKVLNDEGLIRYIGRAGSVTVSDIVHATVDEFEAKQFRERSERAMHVCDGLGVLRVGAALQQYEAE